MNFAIYSEKPIRLEAVGNGSYLYRWNIQEEVIDVQNTTSESESEKTQWKCYEVIVWATLTEDKITEAVINALWGSGVEQKLLNDYNAYLMGVLGPDVVEPYHQFLIDRDLIKVEIKQVCEEHKIEMHVVTIESAKQEKLKELSVHYKSTAVNEFTLNGQTMWLDKATRVGLMNSISIEKEAGRTETKLWFGAIEYTITIAQAIQMLQALELYALDCYNVTQRHISSVQELNSIEEIKQYNYTNNYPDKLNFN